MAYRNLIAVLEKIREAGDAIDGGCIVVNVLDDNRRGGQEVVGRGLLPAVEVRRVFQSVIDALILQARDEDGN